MEPMQKNIFDFKDYRLYMLDFIAAQPKKGRGTRSAIAAALCCPVSHISQVLKGVSHLNMEQAHELNRYLNHTQEESEFFLLLIQFSRAGTQSLRSFFENQIHRILEKRLVLKDRLDVKKSLSEKDQVLFYSSWHYQAIHIMLTVSRFQTREAMSKHIGLSVKTVSEALDFLISIGLAVQEKGRYRSGTSRIHLGNDSPMISKHHINWRMKAIQSLDRENSQEDLHYSSVVSVSEEDALKIKSLIVKYIEALKGVVKESQPEEGVHCFSIDFFRL